MTRKQQKTIQKWINANKGLLGMEDVDITLSMFPADDDAHANADVHDHCASHRVRLQPTLIEEVSELTLRETMVHELLHCRLRNLEHFVPTVVAPVLGREARDVTLALWTHETEQIVDWLARLLVHLFPPIEFKDKRASKKKA